jgi:ATP-dependent Clp protease ATP-binding subunit ClpC
MTSNVGAREIEKESNIGFMVDRDDYRANYEKMKEKLKEELKKEFKPEFLNRLDDVIIFRSLTKEDLKIIAGIMIEEVSERLKEQNISIEVSAKVKEFLAETSHDPHHGARPLRRAIQERVEDALADEILKGRISSGSHILVGLDKDKINFKEKKSVRVLKK